MVTIAVRSAGSGHVLITQTDPKSPVAEAYRSLRTNLQFASLDKPLKSLLVTSAGPDEGKSTVLSNLAVALAQAGNRVIAVGCDLRRPVLHRVFGLDNRVGLTSVLLGQVRIETALQPTAIERLRVLVSGPIPPNPSELLGSARMEEVLAELGATADLVVIDSPPIIAVTDAAVLAPKVDGVLLVITYRATPREIARDAKILLDNVKARIVGVVLNRIEAEESYGYYYYYYYGKQEEKTER